MSGTGGAFGLLPGGELTFALEAEGVGDEISCGALEVPSPLVAGIGGGKGEMETAETEAVCAR